MKKTVAYILVLTFLITTLMSCSEKSISSPVQMQQSDAPVTAPVEQNSAHSGNAWEGLFTYDETNALQFTVKAAIPDEEDTYEYPWGEYDAIDISAQSGVTPEDELGNIDEDELERQLEEALAAAQAQQEAQEQQGTAGSQETPELPADWNSGSNQPSLGGRLELASGETTVIIEVSEYCVDTDTTFTVTPVETTVLPEVFFKGGFSLGSEGETHVTLNDYAIITFLTKDDPGDDVVIKSFGENGEMEYAWAEVTRLGDIFMITGAVEDFSTVGYGAAIPTPDINAGVISKESHERLIKQSKELSEKMERERTQQSAGKNFVQTIEFDEILFTTSAAGLPLQLHLRAKLVEQPVTKNPETGAEEYLFKGKIWIKFYTWGPEGYGDLYMICNDAIVRNPAFWVASLNEQGIGTMSATFNMVTIGGSKAVAEGVGSYGVSGKTYTDVQTDWVLDAATGTVTVTFTSMKGAAEKTFITGKLSNKTQRQANKKLKWFLN